MFLRAIWDWQASGRVALRHSLCFHEGRTKCLFWFQGLIGLEIFQATGGFKIIQLRDFSLVFYIFFFFFSTKSNLGSNKTPAIDTKPLSCHSWGQKALFHLKNEILEGKVFSLCQCATKFPGTFSQMDLGKVQSEK